MGAVPGTSARSGSAEDTSFSGATGAACCPRPAGQPGPPSEQFREKGQKRHCATEARFTRKHGYVWPGGRCTTHGRVDSGRHRLVHLCVFSLSPGKWRENRWKTFLKGNNQPHSADKPEGIYSFIHSLTHSPPGRWGARVTHTHRGILRPGTEAVPTAFRDA